MESDLNLPPEYSNAAVVIIGVLSAPLARGLTALLKNRAGTTGITTRTVAAVLSALVAGVAGYLTGIYGQGAPAVIRAVLAFLTTFLTATGTQAAAVTAAAAGAGGQVALPVIGDHVVLPMGTPGTEPLIHNGRVIGAVKPLTPTGANK